jgi:hypothetical protein
MKFCKHCGNPLKESQKKFCSRICMGHFNAIRYRRTIIRHSASYNPLDAIDEDMPTYLAIENTHKAV